MVPRSGGSSNAPVGWITGLFIFTALIVLTWNQSDRAPTPPASRPAGQIDIEPARLLLQTLQLLVDRNPDAARMAADLRTLDAASREKTVDSLIEGNRQDGDIQEAIDRLLESDAYQLYYRQFRNIGPEEHRRVLNALPFVAVPSPGDISRNLLELSRNLGPVQRWVETIVSRIDTERSHRIALEWLPPGNYSPPPVHFILDGNGDAFAREGEVVFDLYGVLLSGRPDASRYTDLHEIGAGQIEAVLAHEFHHIYARPYLSGAEAASSDGWQGRFRDHIVRRLVSEGVAMHCNPPEGFAREVKEDAAVVAYWIRRLNERLDGLNSEGADETEYRHWLAATYQDEARDLLRTYLARDLAGEELRRELERRRVDRPSLVYTLGWWMTSRMSGNGSDPAKLRQLPVDPYSLFRRYNETMGFAPDSLVVNDEDRPL